MTGPELLEAVVEMQWGRLISWGEALSMRLGGDGLAENECRASLNRQSTVGKSTYPCVENFNAARSSMQGHRSRD